MPGRSGTTRSSGGSSIIFLLVTARPDSDRQRLYLFAMIGRLNRRPSGRQIGIMMMLKSIALAVCLACAAGGAGAADYTQGPITVGNPWARATPKSAPVAGG